VSSLGIGKPGSLMQPPHIDKGHFEQQNNKPPPKQTMQLLIL
jgi:hypothetical protein